MHDVGGARDGQVLVPDREAGLVPVAGFVPCAAGWIFGNGGPMQTVGWMDGYLKVVVVTWTTTTC